MTTQLKDTITNKTTISIGITAMLIPVVVWAVNVQAVTEQNKVDIAEQKQVDAEILKEMRELRDTLYITNNNLTEVNTKLELSK